MGNHLILVDGNNLGFASMANPKLSTGDKNTQGTFTFIKKIRNILLENPNALVMVLWDGRSWRNNIHAEYKVKRQSTDKQQQEREEYYDQSVDMREALKYLGVRQAWAANMEADDLAEIYSRKWKGDKVTLVSGDKDWIQLVDQKVTWLDPIRDRICTDANFSEFTGFKNPEQFVEAKSILGDKDEVPGIKGIGPKTLEVIYKQLNMSFREFLDWHLSYPKESAEEWKRLTGNSLPKIISKVANPDTFIQLAHNDKLGDLRTSARPEPVALKAYQQPLDKGSFLDLCYRLAFMSIARDVDKFLKVFIDNKYIY